MNAVVDQRRLRVGVLTLVLAGLFALIVVRVVVLVAFDGARLHSLAVNEHSEEVTLTAPRGPIVDRNGQPLALSAQAYSIYARPVRLLRSASPAELARLAAVLGDAPAQLQAMLHRPARFVWLGRRLARERAERVEALSLEGVGVINEYKRYYPESNLAAAVVGLAGADDQGLSGLELSFDRVLRGGPVDLREDRDALGHVILDSPVALIGAAPGARLELTIDSTIQAQAESALASEVDTSGARRGLALVLDPFTGEVLAMAAATPSEAHDNHPRLHNPVVQDVFEPGSTIKGVLGAIALEDRAVALGQKLYCENGQWMVGGKTIHDDSRHQWLDLGGIIEVSSNIGAAKIALKLGAERYYRGLRAFGFGRQTGIDLPGEAGGILRAPGSWHDLDLANHGFGQGIAVTALQLATAYATIANGGVRMRPFIVKAAYDADGQPIFIHTPQVVGRAVSPEVAHELNVLLRGVVNGDDGTGRRARLADFEVAGKTGTAQMVDSVTGRYFQNRLVASFVGFVPADNPRLVILVVLEDVGHGHFGGTVAAPVFEQIASAALRHLDIAAAHPTSYDAAGLLPISSLLPEAAAPAPSLPSLYGDPGAHVESAAGIAPDFRGLSLRAALRAASRQGINLEVAGNGYVTAQQPPAGAPLEGGAVRLTLAAALDAAVVPARPTRHGGGGA